jgi:hypothetical protein
MSVLRCESCLGDVKTRGIICDDCLRDFYWLHCLWAAGLHQIPNAERAYSALQNITNARKVKL